VPFLDGLEQILLIPIGEAGETEVIDDEDGELGESLEQAIVDALGARLLIVRVSAAASDGSAGP
jgi:hypothetical protein